jgi:hypothetical protein
MSEKTPWRFVNRYGVAEVRSADGELLFVSSPTVASTIVETVNRTEALRRINLRERATLPAVARR